MKIIFALTFIWMFSISAPEICAQDFDKTSTNNRTVINVPVTVSDREGRYISGLKKEDFSLFQNGVKQNITSFATQDDPISVALVLDTSGSTTDILDKIKSAAGDFIALLNPNDRCLVATFDSQVKVLSPFTSNQQTLRDSLDKIQPAAQEGSVVYGALEQIARASFTNVPGRKVIVFLSDGKDFGSSLTKKELLNQLEESDVSIYTIFYQTSMGLNKLTVSSNGAVKEIKPKKKKSQKKKKGYSISIPLPGDIYNEEEIKIIDKAASTEAVSSLKEISDMTAGRFYTSDTPNLNEIFKKIAGELRQHYQLGFYSKNAANNAAINDITVKVERQDVVVRARGKFRAQ